LRQRDLKIAIHDEGIYQAQGRVLKGPRKLPDDLEPAALPQANGALVGADYEIELHGAKAARLGML
jgi:hypothetical protein